MTATTTPRDFRSPTNGRVPDLDSPGTSMPARARIPVTDRNANRKTRRLPSLTNRPLWTARPDSIAATWAASKVERKRIPNDAGPLRLLWNLSNITDRVIMFALFLVAPALLQGPLRWTAQRPIRRYGLYLVVGALTITLLIGRSTS